jgi:hypothetical protein
MLRNDVGIPLSWLVFPLIPKYTRIFAFVHIKAFTYKPYRPFHDPKSKDPPPSRTPRFRSLGHALDFRETLREIWVGTVYMFDKFRGREPRHDFGARRHAHYEEAFGQTRPAQTATPAGDKNGKLPAGKTGKDDPKASPASEIAINREVEVDVSGERQWLGLGDDYGYGLGYFGRERSDALSVQIEKELQIRGITSGAFRASPIYSIFAHQGHCRGPAYARCANVKSPAGREAA